MKLKKLHEIIGRSGVARLTRIINSDDNEAPPTFEETALFKFAERHLLKLFKKFHRELLAMTRPDTTRMMELTRELEGRVASLKSIVEHIQRNLKIGVDDASS